MLLVVWVGEAAEDVGTEARFQEFRVKDKQVVMVSTDTCFNTLDCSQREADKEVNFPSGKEPVCQGRRYRFDPWVRKIP